MWDSGDLVEIKLESDPEVVEIRDPLLDSTCRISGWLGRVGTGDLDAMIVEPISRTKPIAGGVVLEIKFAGRLVVIRHFFSIGTARVHRAARRDDDRADPQHPNRHQRTGQQPSHGTDSDRFRTGAQKNYDRERTTLIRCSNSA